MVTEPRRCLPFRQRGDSWEYVGGGLPSDFGFPIVGHPRDPNRAYVLPLQRWPRWSPDHVLSVYRTKGGGGEWESLRNGLPEAFTGVLRDAFTTDNKDPVGLYVGSTSGSVYYSRDEGQSWHLLAQHLPRTTLSIGEVQKLCMMGRLNVIIISPERSGVDKVLRPIRPVCAA